MKKLAHLILAISILAATGLLSACATRAQAPTMYDFGPVADATVADATVAAAPRPAATIAAAPPRSATPGAPAGIHLPPISVADVSAPAWLDGPLMFYRLSYANQQQPRPYAGSRWSMTPAQLLSQRVKVRLAQQGGSVLSATDGAIDTPLLRIDTDEFIQVFGSPEQSSAHISLRASLFNGHALVGQKLFTQQVRAPSADAAGGAQALARASDAAISDILGWLSSLLAQK